MSAKKRQNAAGLIFGSGVASPHLDAAPNAGITFARDDFNIPTSSLRRLSAANRYLPRVALVRCSRRHHNGTTDTRFPSVGGFDG